LLRQGAAHRLGSRSGVRPWGVLKLSDLKYASTPEGDINLRWKQKSPG